MSHRFTIVPADFWSSSAALLERAAKDSAIRVVGEAADTVLFFTGLPELGAALDIGTGEGLACLRVRTGTCVLDVDTEGHDASTRHLELCVRWVLESCGPCKVFDDEDGADLGWTAARVPGKLFEPEPEFEVSGVRSPTPT